MSLLRRLADERLRSELAAQKTTNKQLHKALKHERCRANGLAINLKTRKARMTALRKQLRALEPHTPSTD